MIDKFPILIFICHPRLLVGFGAGLGISGGPVFIAEIAPAGIKGLIGVLTQMGIVVGIMLTQAAGLRLATPHQWRFVLLISSVISFVHLLFAPIMVESPAFVRDLPQRDAIKSKLWGGARAFASGVVSKARFYVKLMPPRRFGGSSERSRRC